MSLSISKCIQNFVEFRPIILKILSGNKILTCIKGHNSELNLHNLTYNNPNLYLVIINAYAKFILFHIFILKILSGNEILTRVKGHNSVINLHNLTHNNRNLYLVNINAYAKICHIPSIHSLDIERKGNSVTSQGP